MLVNLVLALEQPCSSGKVAQEWSLPFLFWETCASCHILLDPHGNHDQAVAVGCMCSPCRRWQCPSLAKLLSPVSLYRTQEGPKCIGHLVLASQRSSGISTLLIAWKVHAPSCSIRMKRHHQIVANSLAVSRYSSITHHGRGYAGSATLQTVITTTCIVLSCGILELVLPTLCPKHCPDWQVWPRFCCSHEIKQAVWPYIHTIWNSCSKT